MLHKRLQTVSLGPCASFMRNPARKMLEIFIILIHNEMRFLANPQAENFSLCFLVCLFGGWVERASGENESFAYSKQIAFIQLEGTKCFSFFTTRWMWKFKLHQMLS